MEFSLNGKWLLKRDTPERQDGWITADVPGCIQRDLENAGILAPMRWAPGDDAMKDAAMNTWWYRHTFTLPEGCGSRRVTLCFGGVDYSCGIYINGAPVAENEGEFIPFQTDITDHIRWQEENELLVRIDPMDAELYDAVRLADGPCSGEGTDHHFVSVNNQIRRLLRGLKSPGNLSYDWGTNVYTLGIWKDVTLRITDTARIDFIQVTAEPDDGLQTARVTVRAEVDGECSRAAVDIEGTSVEMKRNSDGLYEASLILENPKLWYPNGFGEQPLYQAEVRVWNDSTLSDCRTEQFGIRSVRWALTEGAPEDFPNRFQLILNGIPIRTMGSCYVSPELLSGTCTQESYTRLVRLAKDAHMTVLRQHGAQPIPHSSFYEACDRLGIMLLVDFPIGNCILENDPVFLENLDRTIRAIIKETRNHPSIIEWTGGNELEYYFQPNADRTGLNVIRSACTAEDPSRLFRDTCPVAGSRHAPWDYDPDRHYAYYNGDIRDNYGVLPMMRYGEFGCQTPANIETWMRDIPEASRWPIREDDPNLTRKNAVNAGFHPEFWLIRRIPERFFGEAKDLETFIREGQFIGAEGLRYAVDALRLKGKRVAGFTTWDYSEPWPNGAGSFMVDYDGRTLMMYSFMKQALSPVSLCLKYSGLLLEYFGEDYAELMLVSDAPEAMQGLKCRVHAIDRTGFEYFGWEGEADIRPIEAKSLLRFKLNPPSGRVNGPCVVLLELQDHDGTRLAERAYVFGTKGVYAPLGGLLEPADKPGPGFGIPYAYTHTPGGKLLAAELALIEKLVSSDGCEITLTLENRSKMPALFTEVRPLIEDRTDLYIDDNFITIPAGEIRKIRVRTDAPITPCGLTIRAWNMQKEIVVEPDASVIAWAGRRDHSCHALSASPVSLLDLRSGYTSPDRLPRLIDDIPLEIRFHLDMPRDLSLVLYTLDRPVLGAALQAQIGDLTGHIRLLPGRGAQKADFEAPGLEQTAVLHIDAKYTCAGENTIMLAREWGWITLDQLKIIGG